MNEMNSTIGEVDSPSESGGASGFDAAPIAEVKAWLVSQFREAGRQVPDFEYTPQTISYLHHIVTLSQAKTQAATVVLNDLYQKSAEYRAQAARMREVLEKVGLVRENMSSNLVSSARLLASVANLLDIRDTELSSFLVGAADLSQRKGEIEEKRAQAKGESKLLLDYTRKAIARLTFLKRTIAQLEKDVAPSEAEMEHWKMNTGVLDKKERQYLQEYSNYKKMLDRVGYSPEIRHGVLVEMSDHRKDMQKKTKAILESLRSYHDLPPVFFLPYCFQCFPFFRDRIRGPFLVQDNVVAELAVEEKKREYAAAEKHLEDVLQSAFPE